MAKRKYKYNPETISYETVDDSFLARVKRFFPHLVSVILISFFVIFSFFFFVDTPKEKALKRTNKEIVANYELLNKQLDCITAELKSIQYRDDNIYRTVFEEEPLSKEVRDAGFGGTDNYQELRQLDAEGLVAKTTQRFDVIKRKLYIQSKSFDEIASLAKNKEKMLSCIPAILPLAKPDIKRIGPYGMRIHPIHKIRKMHDGVDLTAKKGTLVHATGDGVVVETRRSKTGYGNKVVIDHGFGYRTRYAHLSVISVKKGQHLKRGAIVGKVGNTGTSTGPHLHYEVRKNGHSLDPVNFYFDDLTPAQYDEMIQLSLQSGGQSFD